MSSQDQTKQGRIKQQEIKQGQAKKKDSMLKDTFTLFMITLIAGFALGLVHEITAPAIAAQEQKSKTEAYYKAFPEAEEFTEDIELSKQVENAGSVLEENGYGKAAINEAFLAKDASGKILGYVVRVTTEEGYKGGIVIALGYGLDGIVKGMEVTTINETAGLGSKAAEDSFTGQFVGKKVEQFEYTKTGSAKDNQVDAISGATITSSAVVNEVNAGICFITNYMQTENMTGGNQNE